MGLRHLHRSKKKLGFAAVAFAGERVVAIPGPLGHGNKSSPLTCAPTPMVESEGALRAVPSDVSEGGVAYDSCGGVQLLDGTDVIVWSGRVLAWNGERFAQHARDLPRSQLSYGFSAAVVEQGFYCTTGRELLLVRAGDETHERPRMQLQNVSVVARDGEDLILTTVGPFAHHRWSPRTGASDRLDTNAFEDLGPRVFPTPLGLVASAKQSSQLVRLG